MKTAFVILNYNSSDLTSKLAETVSRYKVIDYVVVVDNCSPGGDYESLKKIENEKICVIKSEKNGGYSYGNNYGAGFCVRLGVDIMIVSNPDVEVTEENIQKILEHFEEGYSLLTGIQFEIDGKIGNPAISRRYTYADDLSQCFFLGRKFLPRKLSVPVRYDLEVQETEMFKGSFFAVVLKDFMEVGGFDEGTFLYCEERILARRLSDHHKKIGVVTGARYDHMHSKSISSVYTKKYSRMKMLYQSRYFYNKKYNNIGLFRQIMLFASMKISLAEFRLTDFLGVMSGQIKK